MGELLVKTEADCSYSSLLSISVELLAAKLWVALKMQRQILYVLL